MKIDAGTKSRTRRKRFAAVAVLAAIAVIASACSSSKSGDSSPPPSTSAGSPSGSTTAGNSEVEAATTAIQTAFSGRARQPSAGPAAQSGKTIYVITCGNVALGCYLPAQATQAAGKALGWNVKIIDGKLTPAGWSSAIQQAIAAKPDGVVTVGLDCPNVKSGYEAMKAAKIPVIGVFEFDCNDPKVGGQQLMTGQIDTGTGQDPGKWFYAWGVLHAQYIIAQTQGKAKVIQFATVPFLDTYYEAKGFEDEMAKCTTCKIVARQEITAADLAGPAATKVASAIQAHPDANAISFDNDTLLGIAVPTLRSNPHPDWVIVGSEGLPNTLPLVGTTVTAFIALPSAWLGWCAAFGLNEVFAGKTITDCGADFQVIDKDHNKPANGATTFEPNIDFKSAMKTQWGV